MVVTLHLTTEHMRPFSICLLIAALMSVGTTATPANPLSYSLDRIVLGSNVKEAIRILGRPSISSATTYRWDNSSGGTITLLTDSNGNITLIDVLGGNHERRAIDAAGGGGTLGETAHANFNPPKNAKIKDSCGAGLAGEPCVAYTLPKGVELVANFGKNTGLADWALTELVLSDRTLLLASGRVIAQP